MKITIILPTYNEAENIEELLREIMVVAGVKKHKFSVLVVDSSSPDGTGKIVKQKFKKVHLLTDKKEGLGASYVRGFDYAKQSDVIVMMDADLSHPPSLIPRLIDEIEKGADVAIGSRYIKGGGTPDWSLFRRIVSKAGNFFARSVAGMHTVHDCTSGFRAIRTSLIKRIKKENLSTKGYAFLSSLLFECIRQDAVIKEVPLVFHDRKKGKTKLKTKDMVEFFFNSIRLFFKRRFFKFAVVGASGIIVNLFFLWLFAFGVHKLVASALAIEISIITNFFFNNYWTFKNHGQKPFVHKLLKYQLITIAGACINWLAFFLLQGRLYYILAQFIGILIAFFWNYFLSKNWAWSRK